jgi:hypothetical protein
MAEAYRLKAEHRYEDAWAAFQHARESGTDASTIALECGYLLATQNDADGARRYFLEALHSNDSRVSASARTELAALRPPQPAPASLSAVPAPVRPMASVSSKARSPRDYFRFDLYADALWSHSTRANSPDLLVPTVRARAHYRPFASLDLNLYLLAQATRDTASTSGGGGLPQIYSDNYAIFGTGILMRAWRGRIGFFAQLGAAINELEQTDALHPRVALDVRGGVVFYAETSRCAPPPVHGGKWGFTPCLDGYSEIIYASRFDNNVIAYVRPRAAATYLTTGPVAWQLMIGARAAKDINGNFYNNFVDAGPGQRWRLLKPFRLDLMVSANGGTYFGIARAGEPAPNPLHYFEARLEAATYVEF